MQCQAERCCRTGDGPTMPHTEQWDGAAEHWAEPCVYNWLFSADFM